MGKSVPNVVRVKGFRKLQSFQRLGQLLVKDKQFTQKIVLRIAVDPNTKKPPQILKQMERSLGPKNKL